MQGKGTCVCVCVFVCVAVSRCLQEQLSSTVHQRLTATDTALKEGINQIVHSKVHTYVLSNAL